MSNILVSNGTVQLIAYALAHYELIPPEDMREVSYKLLEYNYEFLDMLDFVCPYDIYKLVDWEYDEEWDAQSLTSLEFYRYQLNFSEEHPYFDECHMLKGMLRESIIDQVMHKSMWELPSLYALGAQ